jgi:hypothetical protein
MHHYTTPPSMTDSVHLSETSVGDFVLQLRLVSRSIHKGKEPF